MLPTIAALGAFIGVVFTVFELYRRFKRRNIPQAQLDPPRLPMIYSPPVLPPFLECDPPAIWEVSVVQSQKRYILAELMVRSIADLIAARSQASIATCCTGFAVSETPQGRTRV